MLTINFEGWFQCRFATDPDPTDDPYGVSGPTFAVAGEPPFDRTIRFQNLVKPRFPRQPGDGVFVRSVAIDGQPADPAHPLVGATVELLDRPQYEQRNLILVREPFQAPIDPFHLAIRGAGINIQRKDCWDVTYPDWTIYDVLRKNPSLLQRRINGIEIRSPEAAEATGMLNYEQVRAQRLADLLKIRDHATDPLERAGLDRRIQVLSQDADRGGITLAAIAFMGMKATYAFALNGPGEVSDPAGRLGGSVGLSQDWPLSFWMGAYDVDTLCGYMRGSLSLPFRPAA